MLHLLHNALNTIGGAAFSGTEMRVALVIDLALIGALCVGFIFGETLKKYVPRRWMHRLPAACGLFCATVALLLLLASGLQYRDTRRAAMERQRQAIAAAATLEEAIVDEDDVRADLDWRARDDWGTR